MSQQQTFDKLDILGVEIDVVTIPEAIEYIVDHAQPGQPAAYVVKPYVEFLDRSYRDIEVQEWLNNAELAIADGIAIVWAAAYLYAGPRTAWRWLKTLVQIVVAPHELRWPLTDRAAGINLTWPLLEVAARHELRIALVGSPLTGTIEHTASTLRQAIPGLNIVLTHTGTDAAATGQYQTPGWLRDLASQLESAKPDLILLGLGFPRQEAAAAWLRQQLSHGVIIGEGGTFDYTQFGGQRTKAPQLFQRIGLEWLWRLILEPRRLKRQLAIPRFIWRVWQNRHQ